MQHFCLANTPPSRWDILVLILISSGFLCAMSKVNLSIQNESPPAKPCPPGAPPLYSWNTDGTSQSVRFVWWWRLKVLLYSILICSLKQWSTRRFKTEVLRQRLGLSEHLLFIAEILTEPVNVFVLLFHREVRVLGQSDDDQLHEVTDGTRLGEVLYEVVQ